MHKGSTHLIFILFFNFIAQFTAAQYNWTHKTTNKSFYSGIPVACADINGDALDDLLILDQAKHLWMGLQLGSGEFFWQSLDYHNTFPAWSINVADIDRNGFNDILISGERTQVHILYQNASGFTKTLIDDTYFLSQAAAIYDLNRDGWLDFTLCDDNEVNRIYMNNGAGLLQRDLNIIQMGFADPSFDAGNYGCIWTDLENDGDPDLYISKCRAGVEDSTDPRRLNQLWLYDQGKWSSSADLYGLDIGDQSWISIFEDFDNDGLKDCLVINHYTPCRLFRQKSDHGFEEITLASGFNSGAIIIQAIPADFDNDGDIDVLVSGNASELWLNDGHMHFTKVHTPLQDANFSTCAYGDFNSDGFIDIYALHADLLNTPNNQKDQLWINSGNENHFIKFTLKGKNSNINGIGARIVVYTGSLFQSRELHGGEAFGIQNSLNVHFGLKSFSNVDSLMIYWPSGIIDKHFKLSADKHYVVEEGRCIRELGAGIERKVVYYCDQIDTLISASGNYAQVHWNTGSNLDSIRVQEEGLFFYSALDSNQCLQISNHIAFIRNPVQSFSLSHNYDFILCNAEFLELSVMPAAAVVWSDQRTAQKIVVSQTGKYFAKAKGFCEDVYTDTLNLVIAPPVLPPTILSDTLISKAPAILKSDAEETLWYENENDLIPVFSGSTFVTDSLEASRTYWAETYKNFVYPFVHGGLYKPLFNNSAYHASFLNAQMHFNVYQDIFLDSISLYTDFPGMRIIDLLNDLGMRIGTKEVYLVEGKNQVYLGFLIPASDKLYTLTTNLEQNQRSFGENSPKLQRSDVGFYYPLFIQDKIRLLTSNNGDSYYYYFYDWVIRKPDVQCLSERVEVKVLYEPVISHELEKTDQKIVHRKGEFMLISSQSFKFGWSVNSLDGRCISIGESVSNSWIKIPDLNSVAYIINANLGGKRLVSKFNDISR
ncbi:MAG: CRTAC1 family protein [Saprospiraceae bacterium]|nr:CRTAC1 family protein [Saprospiraceae bacterium]